MALFYTVSWREVNAMHHEVESNLQQKLKGPHQASLRFRVLGHILPPAVAIASRFV
jgi:hypothetical protein